MDRSAQIWWGAITSARQAREIIAWTAWSLIVIGAAPVASLVVAAMRGEITLAQAVDETIERNPSTRSPRPVSPPREPL